MLGMCECEHSHGICPRHAEILTAEAQRARRLLVAKETGQSHVGAVETFRGAVGQAGGDEGP